MKETFVEKLKSCLLEIVDHDDWMVHINPNGFDWINGCIYILKKQKGWLLRSEYNGFEKTFNQASHLIAYLNAPTKEDFDVCVEEDLHRLDK